jgi:hypothetical protein
MLVDITYPDIPSAKITGVILINITNVSIVSAAEDVRGIASGSSVDIGSIAISSSDMNIEKITNAINVYSIPPVIPLSSF